MVSALAPPDELAVTVISETVAMAPLSAPMSSAKWNEVIPSAAGPLLILYFADTKAPFIGIRPNSPSPNTISY